MSQSKKAPNPVIRGASRRTFLRGATGVLLGLPFLEALAPRVARANTNAPRRLAILWECNGVNTQRFWPDTPYGALTDASFAPDRGIAPLRPFRDKLLIPRGMNMVGGTGHLGTISLSAHRPRAFSGLTEMAVAWAQGPTIDQVLAPQVNPNGKQPLLLRSSNSSGNSVYSTISFRAANQPAVHERNPWIAYRDLVGVTNPEGEAANLLVQRRKSVLDLVSGRLELMRSRALSEDDRQRLDMHFTSIRELESRLEDSGLMKCELPPGRVAEIQAMDGKMNQVANYSAIGRMHLDVMALAFACDQNRLGLMLWANESGGPVYNFDGLNHQYPHHPLSHGTQGEPLNSGDVANYRELLTEIDQWHAKQMLYLLERLDAYREEGGTVLDNTAVVWMNSMTDGNAHSSADMPVVMAGSLGGYFKQGSYVDLRSGASRRPHNMLLTTFMNGMGVPETHFGAKDLGSSGTFTQLLA